MGSHCYYFLSRFLFIQLLKKTFYNCRLSKARLFEIEKKYVTGVQTTKQVFLTADSTNNVKN